MHRFFMRKIVIFAEETLEYIETEGIVHLNCV